MASVIVSFPGLTTGIDTHDSSAFENLVFGPLSGEPVSAQANPFMLWVSYANGAGVGLYGTFSALPGSGLVDPTSPVSGMGVYHPGGVVVMLVSGITGVTLGQLSGFDDSTLGLIAAPGVDITGTPYADVLEGDVGADILRGGSGNDLYYIGNTDDAVEDASGLDTAYTYVPWTLGAGVENVVLLASAPYAVGNALDNVMTGNGLANVLMGFGGADHLLGLDGNDILDGGAGRDVLEGGRGNDTYVLSAQDALPANALALSGRGWVLDGTRLFTLSAVNTDALARDLTGDGLADTLWIGYKDDRGILTWSFVFSTQYTDRPFEAGSFDDATDYFLGTPPHPGISASGEGKAFSQPVGRFDVMEVAFGAGNVVEHLLLTFTVSDFSGTLTGTIAINASDTSVLDTIIEASGEGSDTIQVDFDYELPSGLEVENLALTGSALNGTANAANNGLLGNAFPNKLVGYGGADQIAGGAGNDWIDGDSGNDPLPPGHVAGDDTIAGGDGNDTVLAGEGNDIVHGDAGDDTIVGEGGIDVLYGDDGQDALDGRAGGDVIYGGVGVDIIFGDAEGDSLFGGDQGDVMMGERGEDSIEGGRDAIYGENGDDLLDGGAGDDWIFGGNGADVIDGDYGSDMIYGGPGSEIMLGSGASAYSSAKIGSDRFVYAALDEAGDRIWGFDTAPSDPDVIDLRPLFDALGYVGTNPRADGYLVVTTSTLPTDCVVWVDADGGGNSFVPLLSLYGVSPATLTADFFLVQ